MKTSLFFVFAGLLTASSLRGGETASLTPLHPPQLWERAEFHIEHAPAVANNFDPDQIRIDAVFTSPSGRTLTVPAFWSQDYKRQLVNGEESITAIGEPGWRLRFTPMEPGAHKITLLIGLEGRAAVEAATQSFTVPDQPSSNRHGWVRVAEDRRYFETSDGRALRLIGENVCWPERRGTFNYEEWFEAMRRSGQNFARLWISPWWASIEQSANTLTRYRLDSAAQLDRIFEIAEEKGIYLLLCLDFHGMFQLDNPHWGGSANYWKRNPYQKENGGPCINPNDFFTDPTARVLYQKRLRYLIARYGASTRLLAWQFFNEIDGAYAPQHLLQAADVAAWHRDMAQWLRQHDPYGHLITTSLTGGSDRPEIWSLKELDFSVYHSYGDPAPAKKLSTLSDDFFHRYGKPVLIGEYGVDWRGWGRATDPHMRAQRQSLWGAALGGSVGAALTWWWEEIHHDNVYPIYAALSRILIRAGWHEGQWTPAAVGPALSPAPITTGELLPNGTVFSGKVTLNSVSWLNLKGEAAITGALAAERASEKLSNYLGGTAQGPRQRPMRLDAWWAADANITFRITELGGNAVIQVRVDGSEVSRQALAPETPPKGPSAKIDQEFTVAIPTGHHRVELENIGQQWLFIDSLRVQGVRESTFPEGWRYEPETVALRQADKAIIHVTSLWAVYPAGAQKYRPPIQHDATVSLTGWPDGKFIARWFNTETGQEITTTRGSTARGALALPVPDFVDDIAGIVEPEKP